MAYRRRNRLRRRYARPIRKRGGRRGRGLKSMQLAGLGPRRPATLPGYAGRAASFGRMRNAGRIARRQFLRRRNIGDPGGYTQWTQRKFSKTLGRMTQRKINNMGLQRHIYFWRNMGRLSGQGNLFMNHFGTTTLGLPMYLVELNSVNNVVDNGGTVSTFAPVWIPSRDDTTGYTWNKQNGYKADNTSDDRWQTERTPGSGATIQYPHSHSLLKWVEARMDLWGCKSQPTKFVIELCQLDEDIQPSSVANADPAYVDYWDSEFKPYIWNPSVTQIGYGVRRYKRVLDSRTVTINPTSTTETDADPHCKSLRFFWKLNRQCRYNWKDSITGFKTGAQTETNAVPVALGENQTQVDPKARLYLLIKAANWSAPAANYAAQTSDKTPSLNLQIRTCHVTSN